MTYFITITGFPKDLKVRELKNMFIFYKSISTLKFHFNQEQNEGCIEMNSINDVIEIKKALHNYKFESQDKEEESETQEETESEGLQLVVKKDDRLLGNEDIIKESSINQSISLFNSNMVDHEKSIENYISNLIDNSDENISEINKESKLFDNFKFKEVLNVNSAVKTPPGLVNRNDRVQNSLDALVNNQFNFSSMYNNISTPLTTTTTAFDMNLYNDNNIKLPLFNSFNNMNTNYYNTNILDTNTNNINNNEDILIQRLGANNLKPNLNNYLNKNKNVNINNVHNGDRNSPCNTLFIGNLLFGTLEQDIINLFKDVKGYLRLSLTYKLSNTNNESTRDPDQMKQMENNINHIKNMVLKNPNKDLSSLPGPICFVEFESTEDATNAIILKNGELLEIKLYHEIKNPKSITAKNVRLSFSKNPFGVKPNPSLNDALNNQKLSISALPFYPPTLNQTKLIPNQIYPSYTSIVSGNHNAVFQHHSNPTTPLSAQFNF